MYFNYFKGGCPISHPIPNGVLSDCNGTLSSGQLVKAGETCSVKCKIGFKFNCTPGRVTGQKLICSSEKGWTDGKCLRMFYYVKFMFFVNEQRVYQKMFIFFDNIL